MANKTDFASKMINTMKTLFLAPVSKDSWTRLFGLGFYFSFLFFILSIFLVFHYLGQNKKPEISPEEIAAQKAEKKRLEEQKKVYQLKLGDFRMPYRLTETAQGKKIPLPLANIEIVVRCANEVTCKYLEKNIIRVKDIVSSSLIPLSREELLKPEGKQKIKNIIMQKINEYLFEGEIIDVYFPKLILG
jgi:flagellar basal body-associated protein FliL